MSVDIQQWAPARLRSHPENALIFGDPEECDRWDEMHASIKRLGIFEPLAIKADGTIISGHLRHAIAVDLGLKAVPVRVVDAFASYRDELEVLIRSNTDRRQLKPSEIALAFKRLKETPRDEGGAKGSKGGGAKGKRGAPNQSGARAGKDGRDEAASMLGIGTHEARALETIFTTPGVPVELKKAVDKGTVKPTPAAKAVATEVKRQGGTIRDASALKAVAIVEHKRPAKSAGLERVEAEAERYKRDYRDLFNAYKTIDSILTRRPLKAVLGPTEHHEYGQLIRDTALRAWREIEAVEGKTNVGRQMALVAIDGGKK